jgi:hypothetical protein
MLRKLKSRMPAWIPEAGNVADDIMTHLLKQWIGKNDLAIMAGLIMSATAMLNAHHQREVERGLAKEGGRDELIKMAHDILDITVKVMR